ncbi:hypothetical protein ABH920_003762 [Catenulispora sp. EB89]|uniref:hypothetical protein n=1 Tax=Catenulispora sp. EB89 TaxID=3156257 RepID=UPI0035193975
MNAAPEDTGTLTVTATEETVRELHAGGFRLYGFRAVKTAIRSALPTIWFQRAAIGTSNEIRWQDSYRAFSSNTPVSPGNLVRPLASLPIAPGQIFTIEQGGIGRIQGPPVPGAPFQIESTATQTYTAGVSQSVENQAGPLCALPQHGHIVNMLTPADKILLTFTPMLLEPGTMVDAIPAPAALIVLPQEGQRTVSFDINTGWGPTSASWLRPVPPRTPLPPLLIELPRSDQP